MRFTDTNKERCNYTKKYLKKTKKRKGKEEKIERERENVEEGGRGGTERSLVSHNLITINTSQRTKRLLNYFETIYFRTYVYEDSSD